MTAEPAARLGIDRYVIEAEKGWNMTLEIKPIGEVVEGRAEVADDY
ncbi:hypothetical protein [Streptomyces werraensis]